MRARLALVLWLGLVGLAIAALDAAGSGDLAPPPLDEPSQLGAWVEHRGGVVAAFAVMRLVALAGAWYLLVVTAAGGLARMAGAASAISVTDAVTVPLVRRLLQSALAAGITLGPMTPAVAPLASPALIAQVEEPPATATMRLLEDPSPAPAPAPAAAPAPRTYEVQPGDHLWSIAERRLAQHLGRQPTEAEVVPYWRSVIEINRNRLADPRNPDLIFPEQVLVLPDLS